MQNVWTLHNPSQYCTKQNKNQPVWHKLTEKNKINGIIAITKNNHINKEVGRCLKSFTYYNTVMLQYQYCHKMDDNDVRQQMCTLRATEVQKLINLWLHSVSQQIALK